MPSHAVLFLTDRGQWHQDQARKAAPPELSVTIRRRSTPEELAALLPSAEFIISERLEMVSGAMIDQSPNLKLIVRLGSLTVGIDLEAARQAKTGVSIQPVLGTVYVAEHVLMMTLAVVKRLGRSLWLANTAAQDPPRPARRTDEDTFAFNWLNLTDIGGLFGKQIGILGMGEIGVEFARRAASFQPAVVRYVKRQRYPESVEHELGITYAAWETCLRESDVLISLLPYSTATDHLLDSKAFGQMQRGAYLIHAGSGSVIDEAALLAALQAGQLAGAALDTYEYEPLQADNPLVAAAHDPRSNLLLTPHTAAAWLPGSRADDYSEILRYLHGQPLRYTLS